MDNINSVLFLEYIKSFGFDPNNYEYILELFSSVPESMSRELFDYNQFLLSRYVDYDELDEYGIDGALGYLGIDGIRIPKTSYSDERFLNSGRYPYIDIDYFDTIIGNGIDTDMFRAVEYDVDQYIGICLDSDDKSLDLITDIYENFVSYMNFHIDNRYVLARDTDSTFNKKLLLIVKEPVKVLIRSRIKVR